MRVEDVEAIVVARYDRASVGDSSLRRVHQEDFCQALGVSPDLKYQFQGGPTPEGIARLLRRVDPSGTAMLERFLDMLVFQWLIVGNDAHSKNYALLLSGDNCWSAPLYDACSWMPYRQRGEPISRQRTAMKTGSNYRISSADQPSAMVHTAKRLGLPEAATIERFERLAAAMPDSLEDAIGCLPDALADLPIVRNYAIEQRRRANRCETIASRAAKAVRPRRSVNPLRSDGEGPSRGHIAASPGSAPLRPQRTRDAKSP